jgi:hypothetical protein
MRRQQPHVRAQDFHQFRDRAPLNGLKQVETSGLPSWCDTVSAAWEMLVGFAFAHWYLE